MAKKNLLTAVFVLLGLMMSLTHTTTVTAQNILKFEEPEEWKTYIMDGLNKHHVWARQISPTKLAIGVTEGEGYISIENDTCIWVRERVEQQDQLISVIKFDSQSGEYSFLEVYGDNPEELEVIRTIGTYNVQSRLLYDLQSKKIAMLLMDGTLIDPENLKFLLKTGEVNPLLSAFFFSWNYMPIIMMQAN